MTLPRAHILLLSALLVCVVALALPGGAAAASCANASASPSSVARTTSVKTTVCLVNAERTKRGLRRMKLNGRLSTAAARHARDMVRRDYFSHVSPSGSTFLTRIKRTGYLRRARAWTAGENIAWGSGGYATPRSIVRSWMNSPGHRANILNRRFRDLGLAVAGGAPGRGGSGATYVNTFGARR